jgi:hypothetical protein
MVATKQNLRISPPTYFVPSQKDEHNHKYKISYKKLDRTIEEVSLLLITTYWAKKTKLAIMVIYGKKSSKIENETRPSLCLSLHYCL